MTTSETETGLKEREPTLMPNDKLARQRIPSSTNAFRVYDMPPEVLSRFISYTKAHAGNKAWVAIDLLLTHANTANRLASIEERLLVLEGQENGNV